MNVEEILVKLGLDFSPFSRGMRQAKTEAEQSAKGFEFLGLKIGELKKLSRELGHEFPLLGLAAKAALNPIVGTFTAAILVASFFKGKIDAINESLDRMAEKNADPLFTKAFEAREQAAREAADSMEKYEQAMRNAASTEGDFQKAIDNTIAALERKAEAERQLSQLRTSGAQASLRDQLRAGLISERQFISQNGDLEKQAAREEFESQKREREARINLLGQASHHAFQENARLGGNAEAALAAAAAAGVKAAGSQSTAEAAQEARNRLPSFGQHAVEVRKFDENYGSFWGTIFHPFTRDTDAAEATRLSGQAQGINVADAQLKSAKAAADADKAAADAAKLTASDASQKSIAAQKSEKDALDKLNEARTQQTEWLDEQTKKQKQREENIDNATRRALATGNPSGVAGVTAEDRRAFMPTLAEMAMSGHWITQRMSGAGRSSFVFDSPSAGDARQMIRLQNQAHYDFLHGNREQGDEDIRKIKSLKARMVAEGAVTADPQDVADDFKEWLQKNGLRVQPVMGD